LLAAIEHEEWRRGNGKFPIVFGLGHVFEGKLAAGFSQLQA
jgi:hypothetical protein